MFKAFDSTLKNLYLWRSLLQFLNQFKVLLLQTLDFSTEEVYTFAIFAELDQLLFHEKVFFA